MFWADLILVLLAIALLIPALVVFTECIAALLPAKRLSAEPASPCRVDVIVPAYNEEERIETALTSLLPQLGDGDRLWVIADNCTDDTAAIAARLGAQVIERDDPTRVGKGYALDWAMRRLAVDPADVVVVIDADCQADPGLVRAIADLAHTRGRPVQSRNTLWADSGASPAQQMVLLAFIVKGLVRQRGLARLGAPCFLQGTGMAFPWEALRHATLASEKTAMDMRLTIELALAGHEAIHFEPLGVRSPLLPPGRAAESQRRRWEHGHMETALREVPRLLHAAAKQRRLSLLVLALDMCVPPLALWVWSWGGAIALASIAAVLSGSYFAVSVLSLAGLLVAGSVLAAWTRFGRSSIPGRVLLRAPAYLVGKLPLYHAFFRRRGNRWTPRDELGGRKR